MALLISGKTTLAIGCAIESKQVFVTIDPNEEPGIDASLRSPMTIRFDEGAPYTEGWESKETLIYNSNKRQVAGFANKIRVAHRLVVRWPTKQGGFRDEIFQVEGGDKAIDFVATSCADKKFADAVVAH
jgi:hypothetical protein